MPPGFCTVHGTTQHAVACFLLPARRSLNINVAVSSCMQANGVEMGIYASSDCRHLNW